MSVQQGRIGGPLLANNLLRNGSNLAFDNKVLYLDVVNKRIGTNNNAPVSDLYAPSAIDSTNLIVDNIADIQNWVVSGSTIQQVLTTITISPSQNSNPSIVTPGLSTSNLYLYGNTFSDTVTNDSINITPNTSTITTNSYQDVSGSSTNVGLFSSGFTGSNNLTQVTADGTWYVTGQPTWIVTNVNAGATTITISNGVFSSGVSYSFSQTTTGLINFANGNGSVQVTANGNLHATGNITWDGNITLGANAAETITFGAEVNSNILPNVTNTYTLGSAGSAPAIITTGLQINLATAPSTATVGTTWTDTSGNSNNGTLAGNNSYLSYTSNDGGGISISGSETGTYISTSYNISSNTFTISMIASLNPTTFWSTMWGNDSWSAGKGYLAYFLSTTSLNVGSASGTANFTVSNITNINVWDFVISGTSVTVYQNGTSLGTKTFTGPSGGYATTGLYFASRHANSGIGPTDNCVGTYYAMRVYNVALNSTQITNNYNAVGATYGLSVSGGPNLSWSNLYSVIDTATTLAATTVTVTDLFAGNIDFNSNTITNTANSDISFSTSGTGYLNFNGNYYFNTANTITFPSSTVTFSSTGNGYIQFTGNNGVVFPAGTSSNYPASPVQGQVRYNSTLGYSEVYNGTSWNPVGGTSAVLTQSQVNDTMYAWDLILG